MCRFQKRGKHTSATIPSLSMFSLRFLWTADCSMFMHWARGDAPIGLNFNFSFASKLLSPVGGALSFRAWNRSISASFFAAASLSWATCNDEIKGTEMNYELVPLTFTRTTPSESRTVWLSIAWDWYLISEILDLPTLFVAASSPKLHWRHSLCKL